MDSEPTPAVPPRPRPQEISEETVMRPVLHQALPAHVLPLPFFIMTVAISVVLWYPQDRGELLSPGHGSVSERGEPGEGCYVGHAREGGADRRLSSAVCAGLTSVRAHGGVYPVLMKGWA